jgi:hypothetical protein
MELPLLGVIALAILLGIWNVWSGLQLQFSVAAVNATALGQMLPAPVITVSEWMVRAVVGALIGSIIAASITTLFVWARGKLRSQDLEQSAAWRSGPNAKWARGPGQEKPISEAAMMRMMLMRQMGFEPRRKGQPRHVEDDDEPTFKF